MGTRAASGLAGVDRREGEETLGSRDVPHEPLERNLQMSSVELCQIVFVFVLKYVQCMQRNTPQKVSVTKPLGVVSPGR